MLNEILRHWMIGIVPFFLSCLLGYAEDKKWKIGFTDVCMCLGMGVVWPVSTVWVVLLLIRRNQRV